MHTHPSLYITRFYIQISGKASSPLSNIMRIVNIGVSTNIFGIDTIYDDGNSSPTGLFGTSDILGTINDSLTSKMDIQKYPSNLTNLADFSNPLLERVNYRHSYKHLLQNTCKWEYNETFFKQYGFYNTLIISGGAPRCYYSITREDLEKQGCVFTDSSETTQNLSFRVIMSRGLNFSLRYISLNLKYESSTITISSTQGTIYGNSELYAFRFNNIKPLIINDGTKLQSISLEVENNPGSSMEDVLSVQYLSMDIITGEFDNSLNAINGINQVRCSLYSPLFDEPDNLFKDKKIFIIGDSFADNLGASISTTIGFEDYYLDAIRGTELARDNTFGTAIRTRLKSDTIEQIGFEPDYVLVIGGINDFKNADVQLGTPSDSLDSETFYGALKDICKTVAEQFPNSQCYVVCPPQAGPSYVPNSPLNNIGISWDDLWGVYKNTTTNYGVFMIDMLSLFGMNFYNICFISVSFSIFYSLVS